MSTGVRRRTGTNIRHTHIGKRYASLAARNKHPAMSDLLGTVAVISLVIGGISALIVIFDLIAHPQNMWIMNLVWPITALYAGPFALWGYFTAGWLSTNANCGT